jgi:hypothetical protein
LISPFAIVFLLWLLKLILAQLLELAFPGWNRSEPKKAGDVG